MATPTPETPAAGMAGLLALFDTLAPPDLDVKIRDVAGTEHTLPAALPARRQIEVLRAIEKMKDAVVNDAALVELADAFNGQITGKALMVAIGRGVVALCANDGILNGIEAAFTKAHPEVVKRALQNAGLDPATHCAADVFAIEDLVAGLLPFFVRLMKRGATAISAMGSIEAAAPKVEAPPA